MLPTINETIEGLDMSSKGLENIVKISHGFMKSTADKLMEGSIKSMEYSQKGLDLWEKIKHRYE